MNLARILTGLVFAAASLNAQTVTHEFGSGAYSFSMEFVTIGNPNNPVDTAGSRNQLGSVPYVYNLGKYEVSRDMVLKASTGGGLGLTLADMTSFGGNGADRPATGISWNEAARFVNWLNALKGYAPAYNFTTTGANANISVWAPGQYSGNNQFRHKDTLFFLPTRDEWYKGAYGSNDGSWYKYSTGSNATPTAVAGGTAPGTVVYDGQTGPADVNNAGGLSAFGTMGQGGNAWEWTESLYDGIFDGGNTLVEKRELHGGSWGGFNLGFGVESSSQYGADYPLTESYLYGFRVAMIPEPSSLSLLLASVAVFAGAKRRRGV